MRRKDKAVTETSEVEKILRQGRVCQLAFAAAPVPYIVSLNYGYHDGTLYFHSAAEGRKLDLIKLNPEVAFTVALDLGLIEGETGCDWSIRFQSVVGSGKITIFTSAEEKRQGLDLLMAHYTPEKFSYPDNMLQATAVFKLKISEMTVKQSRVNE